VCLVGILPPQIDVLPAFTVILSPRSYASPTTAATSSVVPSTEPAT